MCPGCRALVEPADAICPYCGWNLEITDVRRRGGLVERALRPVGGVVPTLVFANVLLAVIAAALPLVLLRRGGESAKDPVAMLIDGVMMPRGGVLSLLGSVTPGAILRNHEVWRLLPSVFLHFGILHIAMNMMSLWNIGRLVEEAFGGGKALALYLLTGIAAVAASVGWYWIRRRTGGHPTEFNMAGASGAICGYAGLLAALGFRIGGEEGKRLWTSMVKPVAFLLVLGFVLEYSNAGFRLANAAHAGGFLAGLGAGFLCTFGIRARGRPGAVRAWDIAAIVLSAATVASFVPPAMAILKVGR